MPAQNSFTYKLSPEQQKALAGILRSGNYRPLTVPHTQMAAEGPNCKINLYTSGKCLVQGKGAREWVEFVLEPQILMEARVGYEEVLDPSMTQPHFGIDESGKGDFFGPLVIAAVYTDESITAILREKGVRDSKAISSSKKIEGLAKFIKQAVEGRFAVVKIGPEAYNRLYTSMGNVNRMLAWGHARALENLLEKVPDCPRALSDQFGPKRQIEQALLKKGRKIKLEQRPKAESDPAVAAASIIARDVFLKSMEELGKPYGVEIPRGASAKVREVAANLVQAHGAPVLLKTVKCHFKTTDQVLAASGLTRGDLSA